MAAGEQAFAQVRSGQRVLDAGCGTGVVPLAAARRAARVTTLDLTPELIEGARQDAAIAGANIDWYVGAVEELPFEDASFDVVLSQFGHTFAPQPEVATREMLRGLKPGGTIALATWPPELHFGKMFARLDKFRPPPAPGISPPPQWGDPNVVYERLGSAVRDFHSDRGTMRSPNLSIQHVRVFMEQSVWADHAERSGARRRTRAAGPVPGGAGRTHRSLLRADRRHLASRLLAHTGDRERLRSREAGENHP